MAKRKDLKKNINYICSELFAECVALVHYKNGVKQEDVDNVMTRILADARRVHQPYQSYAAGRGRRILQEIARDFNAQVEDLVTIISQLN